MVGLIASFMIPTDVVAGRTDQGESEFRQYRATQRTTTAGKCFLLIISVFWLNNQLERYGMQKSHPSDEPRRDSAKALILHMGDVEEIDASYVHLPLFTLHLCHLVILLCLMTLSLVLFLIGILGFILNRKNIILMIISLDVVLMSSAVSILQELTKAYTESGVGVHFAHLRPAHMSLFELVGITEQVSLWILNVRDES